MPSKKFIKPFKKKSEEFRLIKRKIFLHLRINKYEDDLYLIPPHPMGNGIVSNYRLKVKAINSANSVYQISNIPCLRFLVYEGIKDLLVL